MEKLKRFLSFFKITDVQFREKQVVPDSIPKAYKTEITLKYSKGSSLHF